MNAARRVALLALAAACAWWTVRATPPAASEARGTFASRLLGPLAPLGAAIEHARFEAAAGAGDEGRAWKHADRALALAPGDASLWTALAHHAVYELASPRRNPDPAARRRAVELGLAILARGEREARDPGRVAFKAGVVYLSLAAADDERRALPIARREAWVRAAEAFERAAAHGEPVAAEAARLARIEAETGGG